MKLIGGPLIGLGGWSRSGKDTAADYLVRKYGFIKHGFSVALKEEVAQKFPRTLAVEARRVYGDQLQSGRVTLEECIHRLLWVDRTELTRALLQEMGTEVRRADNPAYWIVKFVQEYRKRGCLPMVVPDVRFPNEFSVIRAWRGILLWIDRPGNAPESGHASEQSLTSTDEWDAILLNVGSKEALYAQLDDVLAKKEILPNM